MRLKAPGVGDALAKELVETIQSIRSLDLRKSPSIGRRSTGRARWSYSARRASTKSSSRRPSA